jgi:tRNA nucleotidyltransferase (CCA-adding enzyme)
VNQHPYRAPWLLAAARAFQAVGFPLYTVGGVVRNTLMGLPASDIDLCGSALPEQVLALCEGTPVTAVLRAAHFGTVELHAADESGRHMAEYTTFREDSYRCGHKPSLVRFALTPEVDALRRDFSVNALYRQLLLDADTTVAPVIDPTGGLAHLRQGILHTVTADPDQVFQDDGLRILRAARFQAELGLTPTPALLASAEKYVRLLDDIAVERIRDELVKLLLSDEKYPALKRIAHPVQAGLTTVKTVGAWPIVFGLFTPDEAAIAATQTYLAPVGMPAVSGKLALLLRAAPPAELGAWMRRMTFSQRETAAAITALTALSALYSGNLARMDAVRLGVLPVHNAANALLALQSAGEPCVSALSRAQELLADLQKAGIPLSLKALAINGDDLLALCALLKAPPAAIGRILNTLWQMAVDGLLPNEREPMLHEAQRLLMMEAGK